ncbi:MAG: bifunctional diaminohydroxyphosphoribosylaminopyrimidine deaminase/5-amino-6-(5-phosphoribosylamino)uracil reductase RibD [Prevotella sp.]|nr:bifunctional diaminohydroxyphosphoribosylaminopyrimidine deaminase/5-amino-6-(5-phosphoribosylamino)uracil reductase RibD [Prevotella sp.]
MNEQCHPKCQEHIDEMYMRRCLQLASCGMQEARPNPMVGAVIVARGRIIGEGYHVRCGEAHAEVNAFASVAPTDEHLLPEATIYVSLEPCAHQGRTPPCADLIVRKGVRRVVVGCVDPFAKVQGRGINILRESGIDVTTGVLEKECRWLNRRFFTFHQHQRPYIILKWAQTTDGFLDDHGKALPISSPFTKMLVHRLRSECDVILVGRVTEERECPRLNVRLWSGRDPVKRVLSHDYGIEDVLAECRDKQWLSLLVEGGRRTLSSFIEAGLWDEIRVETAGMVVGDGTPAPSIPENALAQSREWWDGRTVEWFCKSGIK